MSQGFVQPEPVTIFGIPAGEQFDDPAECSPPEPEEPQDDQQTDNSNTVTKSLELELTGDVPEGETFSVGLFSKLKYNVGEGELLLLRSNSEDASVQDEVGPCEAGGVYYHTIVELPKGDTLQVTFYRGFGPGPNSEVFHEETEVVNEDMTNRASYNFDDTVDDQDGQQDGQMPNEMPKNGAGGMASTPFPVRQALAGLSLLAGAAYLGTRRR